MLSECGPESAQALPGNGHLSAARWPDRRITVAAPRGPSAAERAEKVSWVRTLGEDRAQLLVRHPFTASLALHLELVPVIDSRLQAAATDGRHVFFNIRFLAAISTETRQFVLAHEVWHCVAGHLMRRLDRDPACWNMAADHEVNALLRREGLPLPDDAVFFPPMDGANCETVYAWLQKRKGCGDGPMIQFDDHDPWRCVAAAPVTIAATAGASKGRRTAENDPSDHRAGRPAGFCADPEFVVDPEFAPLPADADCAVAWRQHLATAAAAAQLRGTLPGYLERYVGETLRPRLHWQTLLQRFVQHTYGGIRTWLPPSRRHIHRGQWLPGMRGQILRVMVAIDTSGSTIAAIPQFLAEVRELLVVFDRIEITLVECDTEITRVRTLDPAQGSTLPDADLETVQGGGGTDLSPPFAFATANPPACLIYLTDGYGPIPVKPPSFPVLWILPDESCKAPGWGEVVTIETTSTG